VTAQFGFVPTAYRPRRPERHDVQLSTVEYEKAVRGDDRLRLEGIDCQDLQNGDVLHLTWSATVAGQRRRGCCYRMVSTVWSTIGGVTTVRIIPARRVCVPTCIR
jgi:hypothetical protein